MIGNYQSHMITMTQALHEKSNMFFNSTQNVILTTIHSSSNENGITANKNSFNICSTRSQDK